MKKNNFKIVIYCVVSILLTNFIYAGYICKLYPDYIVVGIPSFSKDGLLICAATFDDTFLWETETGKIIYKTNYSRYTSNSYNQAAISPDNKYFAFNSRENLIIYDLIRKEYVFNSNDNTFNKGKLQFSPDCNYLFVPGSYLVNMTTLDKVELPLELKKDNRADIVLHKAVSGNWFINHRENNIRLLEVPGFKTIKTMERKLDYSMNFCRLDEDPDVMIGGNKFFLNTYRGLEIIDFEKSLIETVNISLNPDRMPEIKTGERMEYRCISYDGKLGACFTPMMTEKGNFQETVLIFETDTGKHINTIPISLKREPLTFALSNKSGLLAVVYEGMRFRFFDIASYPYTIVLYDIDTGKKVRTLEWK